MKIDLTYCNVFLCFFISGTIILLITVLIQNNTGVFIGIGSFISGCILYWIIPEKQKVGNVE